MIRRQKLIKLRLIEQIVNEPNLSDEDEYKMIENIVNDKPVFDVGEVVVKTTYSPGDDCDIAVVTYCTTIGFYVMRADGSCCDEEITEWKTTGRFIDGFKDNIKYAGNRLRDIDKGGLI